LSSTKRPSSYLQQTIGRYDDGRFVLYKHAELDSYSASSLKQQTIGRYDDGRFVLYKHAELDYLLVDCCFSEPAL
jgi:phage baseplate assembly protein gpV